MPSFQVLVLGFLFVSFRPSLIRSHSCFSGASLLPSLPGFPLTSAFFRPLLLGSDYSAFRLSFPFFPCSPVGGSHGVFSSSVRPVSMPSFRFRYSACCNSFLLSPARFTAATPASRPSSFRLPAVPLGFRFRFWLLGFGLHPFRCFPFASNLRPSANKRILPYKYTFVNTFFENFPTFFIFWLIYRFPQSIGCFLKCFCLNYLYMAHTLHKLAELSPSLLITPASTACLHSSIPSAPAPA